MPMHGIPIQHGACQRITQASLASSLGGTFPQTPRRPLPLAKADRELAIQSRYPVNR